MCVYVCRCAQFLKIFVMERNLVYNLFSRFRVSRVNKSVVKKELK